MRPVDADDVLSIVDDLRDQMTVEGYWSMVERVKALPSAQPDSKELSSTHKALDTVSRQAAIDAIKKSRFLVDAMEKVIKLPFAQPVLTCDGCRHVGTYDTDFPCNGCVRREKDYYEQER